MIGVSERTLSSAARTAGFPSCTAAGPPFAASGHAPPSPQRSCFAKRATRSRPRGHHLELADPGQQFQRTTTHGSARPVDSSASARPPLPRVLAPQGEWWSTNGNSLGAVPRRCSGTASSNWRTWRGVGSWAAVVRVAIYAPRRCQRAWPARHSGNPFQYHQTYFFAYLERIVTNGVHACSMLPIWSGQNGTPGLKSSWSRCEGRTR